MSTWDILKQAEEQRAQTDKLHWEGTFKDYLEIVSKNPKVADLAHARMYDMIAAAGVQDNGEGQAEDLQVLRGRTVRHGADHRSTWSKSTSPPPPAAWISASAS